MRHVRSGWRRGRQEGQSLVEFTLVLPVFILAMFGLLDIGRLVYANSALSQAAREGARLAATEAGWIGVPDEACVAEPEDIGSGNPGAHVCPASVTSFKGHVVDAVNRMAVSLGSISAVHLSCNDGTVDDPAPAGGWTETSGGNACHDGAGNAVSSHGELVSVRIEYTYTPITPIIGTLIGPVPLSGSVTMVIH